jgi:low affinity Fe/Cu permease
MIRRQKKDIFTKFTSKVSAWLGRPWLFTIMLGLVLLWLASGPLFHFSDTWQLIVNTGTTIITFLMVFIIQNTQNRDNLAINIKLDAIMEKLKITEKELIAAEEESDVALEHEKKIMQDGVKKK